MKNILLIIFIFLGGYLLCFGVFSLFSINNAKEWVMVSGQVVSMEKVITHSKPTTMTPIIKYKYEYKKIAYINDRLFFGVRVGCTNCKSEYKIGEVIDIYLNPDNPLDSVVNPFEKKFSWVGVVTGGVFLLFAFFANRFNQ